MSDGDALVVEQALFSYFQGKEFAEQAALLTEVLRIAGICSRKQNWFITFC